MQPRHGPAWNWLSFFAGAWGSTPTCWRSPDVPFRPSEADFFRLVCNACSALPLGMRDGLSKLYLSIDGVHITHGLDKLLPRWSDENITEYAQRLGQTTGAAEYLLYLSSVEAFDQKLWTSSRQFLLGLFQSVGFPARHVEMEVFFGTYKATLMSGIHRERCSNFHFVVSGAKQMDIWEPAVLSPHDCGPAFSSEERAVIPPSFSLKASAGDLMYWPKAYWHVGRASSLCASINLAVYMDCRIDEQLMQLAEAFVSQDEQPPQCLSGWKGGEPATGGLLDYPVEIDEFVTSLTSKRAPACFTSGVMANSLRKVSATAFRNAPPQRTDQPPRDFEPVRLSPPGYIWYAPVAGGQIMYACNGHLGRTRSAPAVMCLFNLINEGGALSMQDFIEAALEKGAGQVEVVDPHATQQHDPSAIVLNLQEDELEISPEDIYGEAALYMALKEVFVALWQMRALECVYCPLS
jgi:50S ribosomal protein L16 3-hydroxylase